MTKFRIMSIDTNRSYPRVCKIDKHPIYTEFGMLLRWKNQQTGQAWIVWDNDDVFEMNEVGCAREVIDVELCEIAK